MNQKLNGIRTRPVRRMTQAELDGFLEKAADILRGNVDHSEFRGYVFALLFFKRISDVYLEEVRILTKHHKSRANELFLYAQESNVATYNISRINMILHGVSPSGWTPKREDSLRQPLHLDANKKLMQFDRIVMNPPFSLESWGYNDFVGGDPYDRFTFGMPPRDNGDYAWMQHVVKSLKPAGKAIVVMSQGILFRGQPAQTEEEDGRNQKADAEYVIREGFVKSDLIECVIVLPSKLFYGNNVPGCLVVLNKRKPEERRNKILMIWTSRHFVSANPQNLLRTCDLMRILVPWQAFGDLEKCRKLIPEEEAELLGDIEAERGAALKDIHEAYDPVLEPLPGLKEELARLDVTDFAKWSEAPDKNHSYFGPLKRMFDELSKLEAELKSGHCHSALRPVCEAIEFRAA